MFTSNLTVSFMSYLRFYIFIYLVLVFTALPIFYASCTLAAGEGTGLPLPRFVSLRAGEVNLRTGPGVQYPVDWVYLRQNLPVQIIAEFDTWRKIRDWQGTHGWVHQSMVSGTRTFIVTGKTRTIRRRDDSKSPPVAIMEPGAIGKLISCSDLNGWCQVAVAPKKGWLRRVDFWGVIKNEIIE
jgi:SH3-like domain-containing protein